MCTKSMLLTFLLMTTGLSQGYTKHLLVSEKAMATNNVSVSQAINSRHTSQPKSKGSKAVHTAKTATQNLKDNKMSTSTLPSFTFSFSPKSALPNPLFYGPKSLQSPVHT